MDRYLIKSDSKILYWLHWFPSVSETFILREILEMQKLGEEIDVFAVNPSPDNIVHPEFSQFMGQIFRPPSDFLSHLKSHLFWIQNKPSIYLKILGKIFKSIKHRKTFTVSLKVFCIATRGAYSLRNKKYKHIHSHFGNAPATGAWIVSKFLGIPFSITTHAVDIFIPDILLEQKINDSKFTATISEYNRNYLLNKYRINDESKIQIIRCGINPDEFPYKAAETSKIPPVIVSAGRLVSKKGFEYLIKAMKILINSNRKAELIIIGGGEKYNELKSLVDKLGLETVVHFKGAMPNDEVKKIIQNSDLFVLACFQDSRGDMDGIPVVLMEALALGVPAISTELSGIPELIKPFETGLLVPPKDSKALADAITLLLNEKDLRKRLSQGGRKLVVDEFNIAKNSRKLRDLIKCKKLLNA